MRSVVYGVAVWTIAFLYSMVLFGLLEIGYEEDFGYGHPKYWTFESIMTPSFLLIGFLLLMAFIRGVDLSEDWLLQSLKYGVVLMAVQFVLDTLVIVLLFGNGFGYFFGLVTLTYLTIPLWTVAVAAIHRRISRS